LRSLHEHGADYLLIGGYALAAQGYQRATTVTKKTMRDKDAGDRIIIERALEVLRSHGTDEA
jgi:hypothetical protein